MDASRLLTIDYAISSNRARKLVQRDWREEGVLRLELIDLRYKRRALLQQMKPRSAMGAASSKESCTGTPCRQQGQGT